MKKYNKKHLALARRWMNLKYKYVSICWSLLEQDINKDEINKLYTKASRCSFNASKNYWKYRR